MRFSVIIPVYKREDKFRKCLDSLLAQDFSHEEYEVFVVEDGSESKIKELVEERSKTFSNLRYLWMVHGGPAAARNFALRGARGEIIAFTDSDCEVPTDWLSRLDGGFRAHEDVVGVGGYQEAPEDVLKSNILARYESYVTHTVYGAGDEDIVGGFEVPTGGTNNIAYYRWVFDEVGLFDTSFTGAISGEDPDLKKRICDRGYKLLFRPLKATHNRDYNWKSFWKQSFERGLGIRHSQLKYGEPFSNLSLTFQLVKLPLGFIKDLFRLTEPKMAAVRFVERYQVGRGQLLYAKVIGKGEES